MVLVQFVGFALFIVASCILGGRLLLLWRRTREWPELWIGVAFLLGGGIGYLVWLVRAVAIQAGASTEAGTLLALIGLAATCLGALANGAGIYFTFRSGRRWPLVMISGVSAFMLTFWLWLLGSDPGTGQLYFWGALSSCSVFYAWGTLESFQVARTLHKRAKLGMADPIVVNRAFQWSIAGLYVVLMMGISILSVIVNGPEMPPAWSTVMSLLGVFCAGAIWIGFYPNEFVRRQVARVYVN